MTTTDSQITRMQASARPKAKANNLRRSQLIFQHLQQVSPSPHNNNNSASRSSYLPLPSAHPQHHYSNEQHPHPHPQRSRRLKNPHASCVTASTARRAPLTASTSLAVHAVLRRGAPVSAVSLAWTSCLMGGGNMCARHRFRLIHRNWDLGRRNFYWFVKQSSSEWPHLCPLSPIVITCPVTIVYWYLSLPLLVVLDA